MVRKEAASSIASGTATKPRNMSEYRAERGTEEQSYKVKKKADVRFNLVAFRYKKRADVRFNLVAFRYKKRNEVEVPTGQPIPQANQVQAQLEDGTEPSRFSWLWSPSQVLLFLVSGLLHFATGLIVARKFLTSRFNGTTLNTSTFKALPDSPPPK
ncbi:hypothetical protein HPB50_009467 [Hyalomma asiaticum]|uniref:Uncharacterized protein n=1 Tax=Hyalomma asiaticum TaxID=266040 RepID=A0ACB7SPD3_HYAAI|nr:hypothetical protein HPB50_009467 [Hyalomma asiaticum]